MKRIVLIVLTSFVLVSCMSQQDTPGKKNEFSFVFMTDIHLTPERNADKGFEQAINHINELSPDFVLTGGDNIMDALAQTHAYSDTLYNMYIEATNQLNMHVYHTMGNHEVFGLYEKSGIDPSHEEFGKKFYENRLAKRYYSFDFEDWHFVVLDAIGFTDNRKYYGNIDEEQLNWLREDLNKVGDRPIVVSTHIPLLSVGAQVLKGPNEAMSKGEIVSNANEVIQILENHNTKLVLQGHLHFLEDINYNGIHYITGGAVSSQWWQGHRNGLPEGYVNITICGEGFDWKYVDFGWEAISAK